MLRSIALTALLFASPCFARELSPEQLPGQAAARDPFVIAPDACGASRYAHLVGKSYEVHRASIPESAVVRGLDETGAVNASLPERRAPSHMTLEFRPGQLNVIVDGASRILSIGCY